MKSENGKTLLTVNFETCATGKFCLEGPTPCEHLSLVFSDGRAREAFECLAFGNAPLECVSVAHQGLPIRCKACIQAELLADQTMGPGEP